MPARRRLSVTLNPLPLIGCIALGLWLGFIAILLTCWLLLRITGEPLATVTQALHSPASTPAIVEPVAPSAMFEQYQQNLYQNEQQQQQPEPTRNGRQGASNPTCQFWQQQDQNASTDKSRANVLRFCN